MRIPRTVDRLVRRSKPLVPASCWPFLRSALSVGGEGPLVGLPALRRILILAPHPDDEIIGPGGTAALLARSGTAVAVVVITDGTATPGTGLAPVEIGRRRRLESTRACATMGLSPPTFLGLADGGIARLVPELAGRLAAIVGELGPDAIFLPWFGDGHSDHRVVSTALARMGLPAAVEIWAYETWAPLPANRIVDISAVIDKKRAALATHRTASAAFDLTAMLSLNRYRSIHGLAGNGFAEAFLVAPADHYGALASEPRR